MELISKKTNNTENNNFRRNDEERLEEELLVPPKLIELMDCDSAQSSQLKSADGVNQSGSDFLKKNK